MLVDCSSFYNESIWSLSHVMSRCTIFHSAEYNNLHLLLSKPMIDTSEAVSVFEHSNIDIKVLVTSPCSSGITQLVIMEEVMSYLKTTALLEGGWSPLSAMPVLHTGFISPFAVWASLCSIPFLIL
jgi:hypothetical protein